MPSPSNRGLWLRRFGAGIALIAVLGLGASFPVESSYAGKAVKAQRVEVDKAGAALFGDGDAYRVVGSPQLLIVEDKKAFVADAPDGTKRLDDGYLKEHGIYPLQLQTVHFVTGLVRLGLAAALAIGLLLLFLARRKPAA